MEESPYSVEIAEHSRDELNRGAASLSVACYFLMWFFVFVAANFDDPLETASHLMVVSLACAGFLAMVATGTVVQIALVTRHLRRQLPQADVWYWFGNACWMSFWLGLLVLLFQLSAASQQPMSPYPL